MDDMNKDPRSLRLYVKKSLGETKLLLLVDQFEETSHSAKNPLAQSLRLKTCYPLRTMTVPPVW